MTSPAQYRYQVAELKFDELNLENIPAEQAPEMLETVRQFQHRAQEIERAISVDIQMLRSQYKARTAATSTGMTLPENRRGRRNPQVIEQERLNSELESKINPLEEVKKDVDALLAKVSVARTDLEKRLQDDQKKERPLNKIEK